MLFHHSTMTRKGPLGFNQEWLLMVDEASRYAGRASPAPEFPFVFRLRGRWDRAQLDEALHALASRHKVLRTVYVPTDRYKTKQREILLQMFLRRRLFVTGMYVRRALDSAEIDVTECDATTASVDDLVLAAMAQPLVPRTPPVRAMVFHVDDDTRVLVLVTSHLICDGWSIHVLLREFLRIYRSVVAGDDANLPPIEIEFEKFIDRQLREHYSGGFAEHETIGAGNGAG